MAAGLQCQVEGVCHDLSAHVLAAQAVQDNPDLFFGPTLVAGRRLMSLKIFSPGLFVVCLIVRSLWLQ